MAYVRPGVEVTQEQRTNTPVLITPDLEACVVGTAYKWVDPSLESSFLQDTITSSGNTVSVADASGADVNLVIVDLLTTKGSGVGTIKHLILGEEYSFAGTTITISGSTLTADNEYKVRVGYRKPLGKNEDTVVNVESISESDQLVGESVSWNPLGFGVAIAMANSASAVNALNLAKTIDTGLEVTGKINTILSTKEVYAIAPLYVADSDLVAGLSAHCNTYSNSTNKKERIAFVNKAVGANEPADIRDANATIGNRRVFSIHPDFGYVEEARHIATVNPEFVKASFGLSDYIYCQFATTTKINGVQYKVGSEITSTIWKTLIAAGWGGTDGIVKVLAPVPGYYYTAQAVGQVIGTSISQPLTNVPGVGVAKTKGSQDTYSEADLNTIAEGGTWIMTQDSPAGPIYCRHQMSTDVTSIAKREMSITKALDFTAKFIRKALKPYIGKYNITPSFLKLVDTVLNGIARYLVREKHIEDMKVLSIKQSEVNPDTIEVEVNIKVLYPVNYIKVTLVF